MALLKETRERLGYSQEEVASLLGIERTSLSKMENGKQKIDPILLFKLAKMYKTPPEILLGIEEKKEEFSISFRDSYNLNPETKEFLEKAEKIVKDIIFLKGLLENEKH